MHVQELKSPKIKGILLGIIVTFIVTVIGNPLAFALAVGIIFGLMAYVILNDSKKGKASGKDRLKRQRDVSLYKKCIFLTRAVVRSHFFPLNDFTCPER